MTNLPLRAAIVSPNATTFTFTLDEPCKTSAGVYLSNGTLVRTLWSKVPYYAAGTYSAVWDGLDDNSNAVATGTYQIKLLQHNTEYVWDGAIGNTSTATSGSTVHRGFYFMQGMTISGNNAFYVSGYNEGQYGFRTFNTATPQVATGFFWDINQFGQLGSFPGLANRSWFYTTSDGQWVYFACPATYNPTNGQIIGSPGCVVASCINPLSPAYFTNGVVIANGPGDSMPNGIYVGTQPGLSGLSVQQNGNLLAAAVAPDNLVYLQDKRSGAALGQFSIPSPGRLNFAPNGNLWVISGNVVVCYTNVGTAPSVASTISGLSQPLDVAVNPTNSDIILVADGGSSQQIKAFDSAGTSLWTYGLPGGYQANGVAVATNKFWFSYEGVPQTFLCFAPDGSFWVGDEENHRSMHFSAACSYIEQIMYQPSSYRTCADQNNPSRVFNQFLEFNVDYTKPLSQAWTLVNNWKANVPPNNTAPNEGFNQVVTLTNGRTYALLNDSNYLFAPLELCELVSNQWLRVTGIHPLWWTNSTSWVSIQPDGSVGLISPGSATWYKASLNGFDSNNNPLWNPSVLIASAPQGSTDPVPRCCSGTIWTAISSNNVLISYDSTLNNGWHFGGVQLGTTNWLWKAGPSYNMNGCGNFEISNGLTYAGNLVFALDRNVVFGYHGEFFRGQGEASQHFHYYDDGLFVGQFGESSVSHTISEGAIPGFAGNPVSPCFIKATNGDYYVWVNDESSHGPQRWHFVNARNIREQTGSGVLGGVIPLTSASYGFPAGLSGQNGNQSGLVSWLPVQGASSYKVYYSLVSGGPFNILAGKTTNLNYLVSGLSNGVTYYCAVTAIINGTEGIPSEQVEINPFDTTQTVLGTGSLAEGGQGGPVVAINPNAISSNQPSFLGAEHLTSVMTPSDLSSYGGGSLMNKAIGTQGYLIYDWGGSGTSLTNLASSFSITMGPGWMDQNFCIRQFRVNGALGANMGIAANPVGTINIGVSDNSFHYLTIVSPSVFMAPRYFTLSITSTNGASAQYSVNDVYCGYDHMYQFLFRGDITLQADATGGGNAVVQAIFLDNASVVGMSSLSPIPSAPISPPTGLHIIASGATNDLQLLVTGQTLGAALRNNWTGPVGLQFTCTSDATCWALGRWVVAGNTQPHMLALCSSSGTVLAYATVTTAGETPGTYAFESLATPYPMQAGTTYYLFSQETVGGDEWYDMSGTVPIFSPLSSYVNPAFAYGTMPSSLNSCIHASINACYGPVNLKYSIP